MILDFMIYYYYYYRLFCVLFFFLSDARLCEEKNLLVCDIITTLSGFTLVRGEKKHNVRL